MELPEEPTDDFPFEIDRTIGKGSMGAVLLARETNLDREVALKVLRPDFLDRLTDEAAVEASKRFLQEARASASFSHPNIVTIHRLGTVDGLSYIAMEWVDGEDLHSLIQGHAPLDLEEATALADQLLAGLGAAHDHDVVHRDVKPGNVLVESDGNVKLTDFGIAHVRNSELVQTQAGEVLGTPAYASPEQLLERGVDARSDIYAVGIILYEMLTGELPFDGDNLASVATKVVNEEAERVGTANPQVPEQLDAVVHKAMAKQPKSRFSSADEMRRLLEAFKGDSERGAGSPSWAADADTEPYDESEESDDEEVETVLVDGQRPVDLAVHTVFDWSAESLGESSTEALLSKLLETPLHADPFAGAARFEDSLFLIYQGLIFAAVDLEDGSVGDHVYEELPETSQATIYKVPDHLDARVVPHLASVLYPPDRLHENLDSSFTDIVGLVDRLREENFDGAVHLRDGRERAYLFLHQGDELMDIFSQGWDPDPTEERWESWIDDHSVTVHVERRRTIFPTVTYRRELADRAFEISPASEGHEVDEEATGSTMGIRYTDWQLKPVGDDRDDQPGRDSTVWRDLYTSDPMYRLLRWMLAELPEHLEERKRFDEWKYLSHWVAEVSEARLYHDLPRPNSQETDFFDFVTKNEEGKVLHLGRQVATLTPERLEEFVADVKAAKKARNDRGDIGAAVLLASDVDDDFEEAYRRATSDVASWMADMTEALTGYEGFVRIGLRRGFHLLPVVRNDEGFEPILASED